jgi:hypothetical protein
MARTALISARTVSLGSRRCANPCTADQRLDHLPAKSLTFKCKWCGRCATAKVDDLIRMFGRERRAQPIGPQVLKCRDKRSRREGKSAQSLTKFDGARKAPGSPAIMGRECNHCSPRRQSIVPVATSLERRSSAASSKWSPRVLAIRADASPFKFELPHCLMGIRFPRSSTTVLVAVGD